MSASGPAGVSVSRPPLAAPAFRRAAILGTGLIGGSVAATLRARRIAARIVGYSPGADAAEALALGLVDETAASPVDAVDGADLVVLAAPIPVIPALFVAIAPRIAPDALIVDCASTKRSVIEAAKNGLGAAMSRFVASHPIAGGERHGPSASRSDLFQGCAAILCAHPGNESQTVGRAAALWTALGARVVEMGADEHDELFAEVSHWPHAVAFALCGAIASGARAGPASRFAGAGLRDTTRIGASSAALWADILLDNRDAVMRCAGEFRAELDAIESALAAGEREALIDRFEKASRWRRSLG